MYGTEKVNIIYKVGLMLAVITFYGLLVNGWTDRIEWLQQIF